MEANPLIYVGLRGMGKTVLLATAVKELQDRGWLAGYAEARRDVEPGVAVANIIAEGSRLLDGEKKLRRVLRGVTRSIGRGRLEVNASGTVAVEVEVGPTRTDLFGDLVRLFGELGEAAREDGVGVALLIDELQTLKRADQTTLIQAFAKVRSFPIVLIGAGLPYLPEDLSKANTYAERFRYERIDRLPMIDVREAIVAPAMDEGVSWSPDALQRVIDASSGYPYFVQLYASETWEAAAPRVGTEITMAHVEQAEGPVHQQLDVGLYAARYDRMTPSEREYVNTMVGLMEAGAERLEEARVPDLSSFYTANERVRSGDVARALDRQITQVGPVRDRLIHKGIIHSPARDRLEFSVPGFADYVRRRGEAENL